MRNALKGCSPVRNLLIGLGMLVLMLALVALLTLQLLSLKTINGGGHRRGDLRDAPLMLGAGGSISDASQRASLALAAGSQPRLVALPSDGPYLHTDGALLRDSQGH